MPFLCVFADLCGFCDLRFVCFDCVKVVLCLFLWFLWFLWFTWFLLGCWRFVVAFGVLLNFELLVFLWVGITYKGDGFWCLILGSLGLLVWHVLGF